MKRHGKIINAAKVRKGRKALREIAHGKDLLAVRARHLISRGAVFAEGFGSLLEQAGAPLSFAVKAELIWSAAYPEAAELAAREWEDAAENHETDKCYCIAELIREAAQLEKLDENYSQNR
jgi:hypothetical protein